MGAAVPIRGRPLKTCEEVSPWTRKKPFGDYIRKKRLEAGLTQKELAGRLYVTESGVSKWERNLSYPDVSLVTAICRELHISESEAKSIIY